MVCIFIVYTQYGGPLATRHVGASTAGQKKNWKKLKGNIIRAREANSAVGHPSQGGYHARSKSLMR